MMHKFSKMLFVISAVATVIGCGQTEQDVDATSPVHWPTDLTVPIQGATFSLSKEQLPGASPEAGTPHLQGFTFFNGSSGRQLADDEAVVTIADGEIVRIDHDYSEPDPEILQFWAEQVDSSGFLGEFALDHLRGRQVWLRHADGHISRYAHLSRVHPELQPGDSVFQGQPIGLMGHSGLLPSEEQPNPAPRLHFELWSPDASTYLGQGLSPLEIHQQVAAAFGDEALPRYARAVVEQANTGQDTPESYPPENVPETSFYMDPPPMVTEGEAFAVPITWEDDEFEASGFYASLSGSPLGVIDAGPNSQSAWVLGAMPTGTAGSEQDLTITGSDYYGQTVTGQSKMASRRPEKTPDPREVEPGYFEKFSDHNLQAEGGQVIQAAVHSINIAEPHWNRPFQPPLEGEVITPFAQRIYHGILRPAHPYPGIEIQPDEPGTDVLASNDGVVTFVEDLPLRGKTVAVAHGGGVVTLYAQLHSISVGVGDQVTQGSKLGTAGTDPDNDGSIRWEVHVAGIPTNPLAWIGKILPGQ